jgi:phospholipid/cholesterol/gamma-HCH transport system permease protein
LERGGGTAICLADGGTLALAAAQAQLEIAEEGDRVVATARGDWVVATAARLDSPLRRLERAEKSVTLRLGEVAALDTAGAWLLVRTRRRREANGRALELEDVKPDFELLLRRVAESEVGEPLPPPSTRRETVAGFVGSVGDATIRAFLKAGSLVGFFGLVCIAVWRTVRHPSRLRLTATINHMEQTGVDAMGIVGLLSLLVGIVFAYQGADQLRRFGAEIYTVNLLGIAVLRELGVLMTAIILAGRSGSAFTAQIGTMKVNEEIDAMQVLGIDPIEVLVLPRLFALVITLPLLAFFANVMGLFGGAIMTYATLDLTIPGFLRQLRYFMPGWTFWVGVMKAPVFAIVIALVGCYEGLRTERSAESVGRLTTLSVVEAIFLVIVLDAAFSILFSKLGI